MSRETVIDYGDVVLVFPDKPSKDRVEIIVPLSFNTNSKIITFKMHYEEAEELEEAARRLGVPKSYIIRQALRLCLSNLGLCMSRRPEPDKEPQV